MAFAAVYFLVYPVWRSQFLVEIWFTEGWNAYFQDAAGAGRALYPPSDALIVNNYPPLSFYAVGALGRMLGADNLFIGRALSLTAVIAIAVEIFACVRLLSGGLAGGLLAAFWYVAITSHNFTAYAGANDPQLAGEAIMGLGLVLFLSRQQSGRSVLGPLLLMVLAGFWKHNMIAIPLAAIAWLLIRRGRSAFPDIAVSAAVAAAGLALCGILFGLDFFRNLFVSRHYGLSHLLSNVGHLQWSAPAFLSWLTWVLFSRSQAARFTALHVPIGLGACLLQWLGDKIYGNAEFDLIIALAIGVGVAFEEIKTSPLVRLIGETGTRAVLVLVLLLRFVASDRQEPLLVMFDRDFEHQFLLSELAVKREAEIVSQTSGDVACTVKVVCREAGKPFVVDDFKIDEMLATKQMSPDGLHRLLSDRGIQTFTNSLATSATVNTSLSHAWARGALRR
ncbi:hypothetical protein [Bradyrhizobium cytisi]|uniref:Glycosyltransferase RgtA/B/C/D-like domain-containing protein n=1 Tax=Bradyrhizobium cytisi TaxID=515489 RepID=A0A5S4WID0_9BRAD|nr:hypothetical protein [Bradyrhizobium cytisi]TYL80237.1 hypothetical protein FXB38_25065 [Bradyrhizobium cytisi]